MYLYNCKVKRIVDGDTVDVSIDLGFSIRFDARIRLRGINAPESRTKDLAEKARGLKAKEYLTTLLHDPYELTVATSFDRRGKYGRVLGILYIKKMADKDSTLDVNHLMTTSGHAERY